MCKSKTILVTGASSGIGKATAVYLNSLGMRVVLVGRNEDRLKNIVLTMNGQAQYLVFDLTKIEEIGTLFEQLYSEGIKLDGMVHAAGVEYSQPIRVQKYENTRELIAINVEALLELEKYFVKPKYSNANSSIVALSSIASIACEAGMSAYASAKAAVNAAVKVSAKEFKSRKIRVNAILPAFVDTPMTAQSYKGSGDDFEQYLDKVQPFGLIEPMQVAYLIEFLLSDKSQYITGAIIPIGGGTVI